MHGQVEALKCLGWINDPMVLFHSNKGTGWGRGFLRNEGKIEVKCDERKRQGVRATEMICKVNQIRR